MGKIFFLSLLFMLNSLACSKSGSKDNNRPYSASSSGTVKSTGRSKATTGTRTAGGTTTESGMNESQDTNTEGSPDSVIPTVIMK